MVRILKKFGLLLNSKQKKKIGVIVVLMLIGAILETMSVSLVVPLITALMQDNFMETNHFAVLFCDITGVETTREFVLVIVISLIVLFILKDAFLFFEYYVQTQFICKNRMETQKRLMEVYLNRPYE